MSRHEIKFLYRRSEKVDSNIEYIGGYNSDGTKWKISTEKVIDGIENGKWEFFLTKDNKQLNLKYDEIERSLYVDVSQIDTLNLNVFIL